MKSLSYLGFTLEEAARLYVRRVEERARDFALEPLTREAVSLLPRLWQAAKESLREALTGMSTTEKRMLKDALQHVLQNLSVGAAH